MREVLVFFLGHNLKDKIVTRTSLIDSGEMQREAVPLAVPSWLTSCLRNATRIFSLRPLKLLRSAEKEVDNKYAGGDLRMLSTYQ